MAIEAENMTVPDERQSAPVTEQRASPWIAFRHKAFRVVWIATVVANIGTWMYNAASGWLMTSRDADPLTVSLVQVASSLPMFLFALPAGAPADIVDKRRFLIGSEIVLTVVAAISAADWVRGRGLAMFVTVFFGAMTAGSV